MSTEHGTAEHARETPEAPAAPLTLARGGAKPRGKALAKGPGKPAVVPSGTRLVTTGQGEQLLNGEPVLTDAELRAIEGQTVDQGLVVITTTFPVKNGDGIQLDLVTLESVNGGKALVVPATPGAVMQALERIAQHRAALQANVDQQKGAAREKHREQQKLLKQLHALDTPAVPPAAPAAPNRAQRRARKR